MRIDDKRIAERCRRPRCKGFEGAYDGAATGENPFCGDALEVRVALERRACGLAVARASFEGYACSLCTASADVLMERASGMPAEDAAVLTVDDVLRWWGGLEVGRTRKGCVDLPVSVFARALALAVEPVSYTHLVSRRSGDHVERCRGRFYSRRSSRERRRCRQGHRSPGAGHQGHPHVGACRCIAYEHPCRSGASRLNAYVGERCRAI